MNNLPKTSNNERDWTPVKYLNILHHNKHKNFLNTLQKYFKLPILGTLGTLP